MAVANLRLFYPATALHQQQQQQKEMVAAVNIEGDRSGRGGGVSVSGDEEGRQDEDIRRGGAGNFFHQDERLLEIDSNAVKDVCGVFQGLSVAHAFVLKMEMVNSKTSLSTALRAKLAENENKEEKEATSTDSQPTPYTPRTLQLQSVSFRNACLFL